MNGPPKTRAADPGKAAALDRTNGSSDYNVTGLSYQAQSRAHLAFLLTALSLDCIGAPRAALSLRRELASTLEAAS